MIYAIVDIETTGGYAAAGRITEVAIHLHDGSKKLHSYNTLVNPEQDIPGYIQSLTGITPGLVQDAPVFSEVAATIFSLLDGKVFVAHNVNFDFSFLKHQLEEEGFLLQAKKLCTVRMSRQIIPGLTSYSLGNLCRHLNIPVHHRHRANGDAAATVELFEYLLKHDSRQVIAAHLKKSLQEYYLPVHLSGSVVQALPRLPGVYYFHNEKGKIIYIGKAKNIYKRVTGHFTHHDTGRKRQEFLRNIHQVTYQLCANELMAQILECVEIKRHWPEYNYSLKKYDQLFGLYVFGDQNGYLRLAIDKKRRYARPVYHFSLLAEGHSLLRKLIKEFNLCYRLCFLQKGDGYCAGYKQQVCYGACGQKEFPADYNERVKAALKQLELQQNTFAIIEKGLQQDDKSCILMERGAFYGMGYLPPSHDVLAVDTIKPVLTPYQDNFYIRNLILEYVRKNPASAHWI